MNLECMRETLNALTASEIVGEEATYPVDEVCEVLDGIKSLIKGQTTKKTTINSNTPQKIMKLYSANFDPEEIADMLDLTVEEVKLVTTTSDNEITSIAQRMYQCGLPIGQMAELLGVPVEAIGQMFGITDEVDDEDEESSGDLSLQMINEYNAASGESDDEGDDPGSAFADAVYTRLFEPDEEPYRGDN